MSLAGVGYPHEAAEIAALKEQAWETGNLAWMLRPYQYVIYENIWNLIDRLRGSTGDETDYRVGSVVASRKVGKSFVEFLIATEFCNRYPGTIVRICAPTAVEARSVFEPESRKLFAECPARLRPRAKGIDRDWHFPNGSMLVMKGAGLQPDGLRGPSSDLNFVDEAAYVPRLQYVVDSILYPMTINTRGPTILCSTLNQSPNAEFNAYHTRCKLLGQASVVPITEAGFSPQQIAAEKNAVNASTWAIEYMCEEGRDADQTVIPEWSPEVAASLTQSAPEHTPMTPELAYWQRICAVDFGTVDNTVILTGYIDFQTQTLWVTGEALLQGANVTAGNVATAIKGLELADAEARPRAPGAPSVVRIGDHNMEMLNTLQVDHKLMIQMVNKLSLEAMVNNLRVWVQQGRIRVAPECVNLLGCLAHGAWTTKASTRKDGPRERVLARSVLVDANRIAFGHFDALATLVYMCLKAQSLRNQNPLPSTFVTHAQQSVFGAYSKTSYGVARHGDSGQTKRAGWTPPTARKKY